MLFRSNKANLAWRQKVDTLKLRDLTPDRIQAWKVSYLRRFDENPLRGASARRTLNSYIRCARSLFSPRILRFVKVRMPAVLPFDGIEMEKTGSTRYQSKINPSLLIAAATAELRDAHPEEYKTLKENMEELSLSVKSMREKAAENMNRSATFSDEIWNAYKNLMTPQVVKEVAEKGKGWKGTGAEFKSAGTITTSNISAASGSVPYSLVDFMPAPVEISRRNPFIIQLVNMMRTVKKIIYWVEMANPDGGAAGTAEGSAKTQQDFDLVEKSANVIKFTSYIKEIGRAHV